MRMLIRPSDAASTCSAQGFSSLACAGATGGRKCASLSVTSAARAERGRRMAGAASMLAAAMNRRRVAFIQRLPDHIAVCTRHPHAAAIAAPLRSCSATSRVTFMNSATIGVGRSSARVVMPTGPSVAETSIGSSTRSPAAMSSAATP